MPRCCRTFVRALRVAGLVLALDYRCPLAAEAPGPAADPPPAVRPTPTPEPTPPTQPAPAPAPPPGQAPESPPAPSHRGTAEAPFTLEAQGSGEKRVIGAIVVDGNVRVSDSAFSNSLKIKAGDPYDESTVREEFRRLWDLDLFEDITVESRQRSPGVYDLIFHVRDRPLISNVSFVGEKAVTETNIQERLSQAKIEVRRGQPVDYSVLNRAEAAIQQLLGEKGYLQARVKTKLLQVNAGQRDLTFYIHEGGKTKIKKIEFMGNKVFAARRLRKMLKLTKQAFWLTSWASSKDLYHPAKFDQDSENIRTAYKSVGYLDIAIKPEVVELESEVKRREHLDRLAAHGKAPPGGAAEAEEEEEEWEPDASPFAAGGEQTIQPAYRVDVSRDGLKQALRKARAERKKRTEQELKAKKEREKHAKKWVYLTVPIEEGTQYRVGSITMDGNSVFNDREILARLPMRKGMVFNDSALKVGTKRIEDDYGERGYFYVSLDPQVDKHERVADLKLQISEDKKYSLDHIEFTGNTTTRDRVLRREMPLSEQDLFNVRRLRLGIRKIGQLGYFQVGDEPVVKPEGDTGKVNVELQGTESNRNEIQVGGGVSGLEGGFFQASYSTRNFLGKGEILSTFIQTGARANRYSINFTEPWFLGKPWTLGFSLFKRQTTFVGFQQNGTGGNLVLGRILGNFTRFDVAYGYETIDLRSSQFGLPVNRTVSTTSSMTSIYSVDTRNNFFRPTRGARLQGSVEYAGGALGGDNFFWKPRLDATLYLPGLKRRHYIGLNASIGYVAPFAGRVVPVYERFFLGGERSLRVFKSRTVSPTRKDKDLNGDGVIDLPEDSHPDGIFEACEDLNHNGRQDPGELDRGNCRLDPPEDSNNNGVLDTEDLNRNGVLDPGEDLNGNGILDTEDRNHNGILDPGEDSSQGNRWVPFCPADDPNMNGQRDGGEVHHGNCRLDAGEDTNGDGAFVNVFPGGNKFLLLNLEYSIPASDAVEFALFYDAGNAFDDSESVRLNGMRVDYGLELRFYLPVFQAPLRLIYGFIENPRLGESRTNFIFSIGTTF